MLDVDGLWKIVVLLICIVFSGLYSASETALTSLSKIRLEQMIKNNIKGVDRIEKLYKDPKKMLSAILIGNNLVNIGASSLMTSLAIDIWGNTGVGIATGIMTLIVLVFGEITPKTLATQNSEQFSLGLSRFVLVTKIIVTPVSSLLNVITNILIRFLGGEVDEDQPFITEDELKTIVSVSHKEGILEGEEKDMIYNVFDFGDSKANDVMIPRTEMVAIDIDSPYEIVIDVLTREQYSRIPVYEDTTDNIVGILYAKDLLFLQGHKASNFDLKKYIRKAHFTYEYKLTKELFNEMRATRTHMVIVLDEYGGTEGIVTIEDLIEEIVGEIEDEYDKQIEDVQVIEDNEYLVNGGLELEDMNILLGTSIESDDFDTIAGFIIDIIDRIPASGEVIDYGDYRFIVESIDKNRIDKVRIILLNPKKIDD